MRTPLLLTLITLALTAGCGDPSLQVDLPLAVVNIAPQNGAVGVEVATVPTVCFNQEMDAAAAAGSLVLEEEGGAAVKGLAVKSASADANCMVLEHEPLQADASYRIRAKKGLAARSGESLAAEVSALFRTAP